MPSMTTTLSGIADTLGVEIKRRSGTQVLIQQTKATSDLFPPQTPQFSS
jgi:hypothetical protein